MASQKILFRNQNGQLLAGRLDLPAHGKPQAFALFAPCFTCGKDVRGAVNICRALCMQGIATLRIDFTGLGESEGDFAATNFTSSVADILAAAQYLEANHQAPRILVGHSLGGAIVLEAAHSIPSCVAVATIGAPANPEHVAGLLGQKREELEQRGEVDVEIAGRPFHFRKQFLEDLGRHAWCDSIHRLRRALLIFHSPVDRIVDIGNAGEIFRLALHPKSFISLNEADHLLSKPADSEYVGVLLAAWARKYLGELGMARGVSPAAEGEVVATLNGDGLRTDIYAGMHTLVADEPTSFGGTDAGPSPYGLLSASLGACTAMTMQMYARQKAWQIDGITVRLRHEKVHGRDCEECETKDAKVDRIEREIELDGALDADQRKRLLEIADKCPVHRTLRSEVVIHTTLKE